MKRRFLVLMALLIFNILFIFGINYSNKLIVNNNWFIYLNSHEETPEETKEEENVVVDYEGESIEEIATKMNNVFKETLLEGYGNHIAKISSSKKVNPYLIGGIILESTSCKTECSIILKKCKNVSGMKGEPGCFGGSYKEYSNITDSISDLVNKINNDFDEEELKSPNNMFKKYGKNVSWAFRVSEYMELLKRGN